MWLRQKLFDSEQLNNWLIPSFGDYNCTGFNYSMKGPSAIEFLSHLETYQSVLIGLATLLVTSTSIFAIIEYWYVYRNVVLENRRNKLYFLISLFPITMILCLIGMIMPRAASLATSGGILYFSLCLFVLVSLIRHLKNGRHELSRDLLRHDKQINFQSPPCCCCLWFLPEARPTFKNLRLLEFLATIMVEIQRNASFEVQICEFATAISFMLAIFGVHITARLVSDQLSSFGIIWIFRIVDTALLIFTAQHPIIFQNILLRFNLFECGPVLNPFENALFISNFVLICELFLLSTLSMLMISPSRNKMFDGYTITHVQTIEHDREDADSLTDTTITSEEEQAIIYQQPVITIDCSMDNADYHSETTPISP
ncbi:hypothetical protein M3Y97_00480900 [Aphelenchoides bicaudatus]|nr:hypothetical protein M3Y97_00480900 [Aphelenchoides bicaudatus]